MNRFERRLNPPKITEIHRLHRMLRVAGIEHDYFERWQGNSLGGWLIHIYGADGNMIVSAVEGMGTYGAEDDLIEIMGLLTPEEEEYDSVKGFLTAEEVFERIKKAEGVVYSR